MFTKKSIVRVVSIVIVILLMSSTASAHPLQSALGTSFTYQGKLTDGGAPANGAYDLVFKLYNALNGGSQVGSTFTWGGVPVTNGLFTVQLDFGDVFDGTALYLEISVRLGTTDAFTTLTPRQPLSATPYAIYAAKVPWSGITGMPAGFADGVDNGSAYQNVKVVAKSGGDFTSIQAALDSITNASDTNRYLVHVAPGVYTERVTMKQYVDIEGSGELTTKITFTGSAATGTSTLLGANNAELRFLTVENTGNNEVAIAIYNNSAAPRLTHVTASASGGTNQNSGVVNHGSSPTMTDVTASASGGTGNYGVYNDQGSSPTMTNVTASASGGTGTNIGVVNHGSSPTMTNVTASASGGSECHGVHNLGSSPTMTNVTASASGGTNQNFGVSNISSSSPTMTDVTASAEGSTSYDYGVSNTDSSPMMTNVTASTFAGNVNFGVSNTDSSPVMINVTTSALEGLWFNVGIENDGSSSPTINNSVISGDNYGIDNTGSSSPTINNSVISGDNVGIDNSGSSSPTINNSVISGGSSTNSFGIYNGTGTGTIRVSNSQISGKTNTIQNFAGVTILVGDSQLNGGPVTGDGTLTCIGAYNASYLALNSTCQ